MTRSSDGNDTKWPRPAIRNMPRGLYTPAWGVVEIGTRVLFSGSPEACELWLDGWTARNESSDQQDAVFPCACGRPSTHTFEQNGHTLPICDVCESSDQEDMHRG